MTAIQILPKNEASLPAKYEVAKVALRECDNIDECKSWADKSQALASYAKQADDKEMEQTAQRIRARAVRRCGELLKLIEPQRGGDKKSENYQSVGGDTLINRQNVAREAGMSKRQQVQAIRVANVPEADFEEQLESESPPTIESLAEQGTKKAGPRYKQLGMSESAYKSGIGYRWNLGKMADVSRNFDAQDVVDGSTPEERDEIRKNISTVSEFFGLVMEKISA